MKITIIMNPSRDPSRIDALRPAVARLRRAGHRVAVRLTFEAGDALRLARWAARGRADLIIVGGGDGTVNEVVNGIVPGRWHPRLGILPMGTANDFAAGLGLPEEMGEALRIAVEGRPVAVDVARVNRRFFVNVSTGGFGARATEHTTPETKRLLGPLAYLVTGVREFVDLHPARARFVTAEGELYAGQFLLFAVGNARRTGGGSMLTPLAEFGDGKLDVMVVRSIPRLEFLALLPELRAGSHIEHPAVLYVQTPELTVRAREPLSVNADGEPLYARRYHYTLHPRPISVMAP